jgi:hypothetical protein
MGQSGTGFGLSVQNSCHGQTKVCPTISRFDFEPVVVHDGDGEAETAVNLKTGDFA